MRGRKRIKFMPKKTKANVGCGSVNFGPAWWHVDKKPYAHLDSNDIELKDVADESLELVYASHVIEYFDSTEVVSLLRTWWKRLRFGGILRLAVPDFAVLAHLYAIKQASLSALLGPLYGKIPDVESGFMYHKMVYDRSALELVLEQSGFKNIRTWDWRVVEHGYIDDCSQAYMPHMHKETGRLISLNLEADK